MSTPSTIESEIASLPPNLRSEVLDFVQFVKQRHGLASTPAVSVDLSTTGNSDLFQALEAAGFVGCTDSNKQLATTYKHRLDFSGKCRTQT